VCERERERENILISTVYFFSTHRSGKNPAAAAAGGGWYIYISG